MRLDTKELDQLGQRLARIWAEDALARAHTEQAESLQHSTPDGPVPEPKELGRDSFSQDQS